MKTIEAILKEENISKEELWSAKDRGAGLLEKFGKACMVEAIKESAKQTSMFVTKDRILKLIDEIK